MSASSSTSPPKSTARVSLRNLFKLPKKSASRSKSSTSFFERASNVKIINSNFSEIHGDATIIRFGDGQFTDVQRNWICDYMASPITLPDINDNLKRHVLTQSIISLPRAAAVFDDYQTKKKSGPCFEGTRVTLLREMADWAICPGESRMYVLSGLAGIGKSTVAYTIASRTAGLNLLGASFFFSRDEADRNNAKRLFSTIAYQLCVYDETFAKAIGDVLLTERGSAATTKEPQEQLQVLILDPLQSIVQSRPRPVLIVVDALDECDDRDEHAVVMGLSQLVRVLPSFKVILTTRPQPLVDYLFGDHDGHKLFHLQDIEDKVVDGDIRLYLSHSLSQEQVRARLLNPKGEWCASDEDIESLVRAAGRLFIIASTAVLYVLNKALGDPGERMKKLLVEIAQDRTPFNALNHFYSIIVRSAIQVDDDDNENDDIVDRYQIIVGVIVVIQTPLPVTTLAYFIGEESEKIYAMLRNLQSVIFIGGDDVPRIYHKSFPDYLTDQARCKDPRLRIDPRMRHTQIATRCFEIMDKHLRYNILGLGDWARFMSNKDGHKEDGIENERLQEKIPHQLRYACIYWANHLEVANIEDADLMNGLAKLIHEHMLHWFEVLSLIGKLNSAYRTIGVVLKLLKSRFSNLHRLLSDALRFISKFYEVIERSALHTYYSALPFTPRDTLLYCRYIKEALHNICGIQGGPGKWDALVANLSHEKTVNVIKFSLDSAHFVSYFEGRGAVDSGVREQGKLNIWDAATGTPISTISGDRFAVADDFSTVASSEDNTITFYNMNGSVKNTMFTTSSKIVKLALSESSQVSAALSDGTVWLWKSRNAALINIFDGFESRRVPFWSPQLQFSSTGTRLAYSSANGIVKLWDGITGRFIADLQCGLKHNFKISGDGSRIASLTSDCGLTLWNSETGGLIGAVRGMGRFSFCLAITENGSLLATAEETKVTLWSDSENRDHLAQIKVLPECEGTPQSMAFSRDNLLAIATLAGTVELYSVKTHSFIFTFPFSPKSWGRQSTTLTFSPDCTHLACGNRFGNVYLWDIQDIDTSSPPIKDASALTSLTLSRDCSRLVCGFLDGIVELWGTSPAQRRIASHRAHRDVVKALRFAPDCGLFASVSSVESRVIKLWNGGDGSLRGTFHARHQLDAVALSNTMLVAAGFGGITLYSLDTLTLIHAFEAYEDIDDTVSTVSIAENSALIAVAFSQHRVSLFDVVNYTTITTFDVPSEIRTISFLPDNSQLVAQFEKGDYLSLDLINKRLIVLEGPPLEHLIQLPNSTLWHGVPILHYRSNVSALFSRNKGPVPILWIPKDLPVTEWTNGSSMIALGCRDGRVILLRPYTSHIG